MECGDAGHAQRPPPPQALAGVEEQNKHSLITFRAENDWNVIRFQVAFGFNAHQQWTAASRRNALTWISTALKSQRERTFLRAEERERSRVGREHNLISKFMEEI